MSHPFRFSIVTISFNQAEYLERALRSVLDQNYPNLEYIVVDPGSTDGSRDIIDRYRERIDHVILETDEGPADALNKGFARATGDILGYINSDDAFLPGIFADVAEAFRANGDADVLIGNGYIVDGEGQTIRRFYSAPFIPWRVAYRVGQVCQQATFFRAEAFRRTSGFNRENKTTWDAEILIDLWQAGAKFRQVPRFWGILTIHEGTITSLGVSDRMRSDHRRLFERLMGRPQTNLDDLLFQPARLWRWLTDPRAALGRLADEIMGPPKGIGLDGRFRS